MVTIVICLLIGTKIYKFKANNGNVFFPTWFCLGNISDRFQATESIEESSEGNV